GSPLPAFDYGTTTTYDFSGPQYSGGSGSEQTVCPAAPFGASASKAISPTVSSPPAQGSYKWQVMTQTPGAGANRTVTVTRYVTDYVEHVSKTTSTPNPQGGTTTTFTFDVVSPGAEGGTVTTTYQVKQNAIQVSSGGQVSAAQSAGEPDRGIAISSVVDRDAAGTITGTFNPTPAVLLLPLAVQSPQKFQAVGVDPSSGASFTNDADVTGQIKRVNACGQLVDGWEVTSTQTFSDSAGTTTSTVDYAIAPQYGGLVTFQAATPAGSSATETDTIGQLTPGPLPPGQS
ncbi:MAG: hypothetical protein ACYCTI_12880, partial [Acidimicrobiales bacterium]